MRKKEAGGPKAAREKESVSLQTGQRAFLYSVFLHLLHTRFSRPGFVAEGAVTTVQLPQEWPRALPEVCPQRLHFFAAVQVAEVKLWPSGVPVVALQRVHFRGALQVAEA